MTEDEKLAEQGFDLEKWRQLQALGKNLVNWQEQAIQLACPYCHGELKRNDIVSVYCPGCYQLYNCQTLAESQAIKLEKLDK